MSKSGSVVSSHLRKLASSAIDKVCNELDEVRFVSKFMDISDDKIGISDVPSSGAISMLVWARGHRDIFYGQLRRQLLPSRNAIDAMYLTDREEIPLERVLSSLEKEFLS